MSDGQLRDKVPPNNPEAEQATLGAILLDPEALGRVLTFLRADDFYKSANARIFDAIIDLWEKSEGIDLITLTKALKSAGDLDLVGGADRGRDRGRQGAAAQIPQQAGREERGSCWTRRDQ